MISIKQFMEARRSDADSNREVLRSALQTIRLLLEALGDNVVQEPEQDYQALQRHLQNLARRLDDRPTSLSLLSLGSEAIESLETFAERSRAYFREQNAEMQSIVAMLTHTIADISGQADASIGRLQAIEHKIETASELEDVRVQRSCLADCLAQIREAVSQQRRSSAATIQRLHEQIEMAERSAKPGPPPRCAPRAAEIDLVPEVEDMPPPVATPTEYVAAFKLQRSEHIASRFGESAKHQMLSLISQTLKSILGPNDRLLRWKGQSFVMFFTSTGTIADVRAMLSEAVAKTGQHYIEVGKKSALLSVGVDWIVFPQSQCSSLDAVFDEVDAFLLADPSTPAVSRLGELK
jgi:GGDEF domain-containing protein